MIDAILCALFAHCAAPQAATRPPPATPAQVDFCGRATMDLAEPLVAELEGLRQRAYLDTIASPPVLTICYGETVGVKPNEVRTVAQCRAGLRKGLTAYCRGLSRYITPEAALKWMPPTRAAGYTSGAWNIGVGGLGQSTSIRRLNAGDVAGACEALGWFNRAGQRVVRGLVNRRAKEVALCRVGLP